MTKPTVTLGMSHPGYDILVVEPGVRKDGLFHWVVYLPHDGKTYGRVAFHARSRWSAHADALNAKVCGWPGIGDGLGGIASNV